MIISDDKKFVFLHNPKAAGTTVRFALKNYDSYEGKFWRNHVEELDRHSDMAHLSVSSIKKYFPEEYKKIDTYFSFGFVRHPIHRFFSGFNETHKPLWKSLELEAGFLDEYKKVLLAYTKRQLATRNEEGLFTHVKRQKTIYYDNDKCIADVVINIEEWKDKIYLLKNHLDTEVASVVIKAMDGKPRNKKQINYKPTDILDTDILNQLVDYYSDDYEAFGYEKNYY
ncbi:sulfotransferase family 2 domain-containing protein [Alteromonas sp. M12]|uniref:sulfotransferase family 2 domain-containing protein n=1 Tax=Alteromonas sp. M12 TaxID=3135644 RepID=UPI00319E8575